MKTLLKNWSIYRVIKLVIGVGCIVSFPAHREEFFLLVGAYFLYLTFFYPSCKNGSCIN